MKSENNNTKSKIKKILLVDDKKIDLHLMQTLLENNGYEVISATNGEEALEKLRAKGFDMIVSDILMPVMDGFQLCRKVKENNELKHIPFVFYTATYTDEKDEELAVRTGADKFIRKPIDTEELIKIIQDIIKDFDSGKIISGKQILKNDKEIFKLYNERLVKKLENKMLALEKELTKRKQTEKQLKLFNRAIDQSPVAVIITDSKGDIEYVNPKYTEMTGYT